MQLDGEPWPQRIPAAGDPNGPLILKIGHLGLSKMLYNKEHLLGGKQVKMLAKRGGDMSSVRSMELVAAETARDA